jgi:predicted Zn finger-like uncharacterized protein
LIAMPTADEKYTRCPGCSTVFRVTPPQLALRDGQVRCGHCRTVFDGNAQMISLAPLPRAADAEPDDLALGPPTMTLRSARALDPPPPEAAPPVYREPSFRLVEEPEPKADVPDDFADRLAAKPVRRRTRHPARWPMATVAALLAGLLLGQALFHFRDALAARFPAAKPALVRLCEAARCTIRPLRDVAGLAIDASDLQADPAHRGLLVLTATVRNRAATPLAYPYLELTLTDSNDQVVVRRALAPADYASGTTEITNGIPANGEVLVKLFIDASATTQAGYRLYLFYP